MPVRRHPAQMYLRICIRGAANHLHFHFHFHRRRYFSQSVSGSNIELSQRFAHKIFHNLIAAGRKITKLSNKSRQQIHFHFSPRFSSSGKRSKIMKKEEVA